jgi:hypothetical protein
MPDFLRSSDSSLSPLASSSKNHLSRSSRMFANLTSTAVSKADPIERGVVHPRTSTS